MNYIIAIKSAIFAFPIIALLFTIPFILHQYHKYGAINFFRSLIIYSFILYLMVIYFLVILPLPKIEEVTYSPNMVKLIPFGFINDFLRETSFVITSPKTYLKALTEPCFYTVIFNVFMTIPFGMYLRYYFKCDLRKTIKYSFLLSLFFELTQLSGLYFIYPYPYRVFDVDDLITNTLGGIIGFGMMKWFEHLLPSREQIDINTKKSGQVVSGFRRITIFCFDFVLYNTIAIFAYLFFPSKYTFLILFILYYILYPFINENDTLGSKFLNVQLLFPNHKLLRTILRIVFLYFYYFGIPILSFMASSVIVTHLNLQTGEKIWLYLMTLIGIFLFYMINIIILMAKKTIYYDNFFKVKYQSTIKELE